jgi:hypothetical protein
MSKNLKWTICLGGLIAPWLLAPASLPAVAAGLTLDTVVTLPLLPNGNQAVLTRLHQLRGLGGAKVLKSLGHSPKGRHYRG